MSINGFNSPNLELSSGSSTPVPEPSSDSSSTVTDASQLSLLSTVVHDHFRGEALMLQQQIAHAKSLRDLNKNISGLNIQLLKCRREINILQHKLELTNDSRENAHKECTKHHNNWLELLKKNHSLVCMVANLTIENGALKKELNDSQEINLSAVDYVAQVEKENATLKNQLSFLKKSAVIGFIGLGTLAFVATQLKQPQSFGRSVIQMAKSFLFDRMVSSNRGAISIAKEAAIEVAHMANNTATAMINSVADSLKGVSENPVTGPDFTH